MPNRFGYACLNVTLGRRGGFRGMIKRTWLKEGLPHASRLALENSEILCGIIDWNNRHGIQVYRMTSSLVPWASEYELEELPDWSKIQANYQRAAALAAIGGQRLSFHPGQFNCLTSPREHVVKNCVRDLRIHGDVMDAMGLPRSHWAKINIHMGGSFGEKEAAMDRWCKNFELLPDSVKSRLTLENDDKGSLYSVKDLNKVSQRLGVPTVFDFHHQKFCDGGMSEEDALHLAASTWPKDIRPCTHYSESASTREGRAAIPQAHSSFVDGPVNSHGLEIDCVVEAKAKELAVFQLITGKNYESKYADLRGFTNDELNESNAKVKADKKAARKKLKETQETS